MPVDPCLPVPLGGFAPPTHPPIHRIHRIIGRVKRHGTARHVGIKHGMAPLDGCGRVAPGLPGALPGHGTAAFLPKIIPPLAIGGGLIGGSGIIGGFGSVPTGPIGPHGCVGNCGPQNVPEPASFLLLGLAMLFVVLMRKPQTARQST
jgi:hypothetical protein